MADSLALYLLALRSARPPVAGWQDTTAFSNATTSLDAMSKSWPIYANDPQPGVGYRLTVGGFGAMGGTAENIDFQVFAFGTAFPSGAFAAPGSSIGTSTSFHWKFVGEIAIEQAGSSGTAVYTGTFLATGASASVTAVPTVCTATNTVNTTATTNATFQAGWAAITGSPSVSSLYSFWERIGP